MKTVFFLFCMLGVAFASVEAPVAFVYDAHGKVDPFWPLVSPSGVIMTYDTDVSATDMVLEGLVTDAKGNNLAIINGKVVKSGDQVGAYTIESISNEHVDIIKGQERMIIKLKKGGV